MPPMKAKPRRKAAKPVGNTRQRVGDVAEPRWQAARRGNVVASGDQAEMIDKAGADALAPIRRPRKKRAPDCPTHAVPVEMSNFFDLTEYLFASDDANKKEVGIPDEFYQWRRRVENGEAEALREEPKLVQLAVTLECIRTRTSFGEWRDRPETGAKGLSLRPALREWLATEPKAHAEVNNALGKPLNLDLRAATIAFAPLISNPIGSSRTFLAARVLHDRIIRPILDGQRIAAGQQEVLLQAFTAAFGIDVENAWILPFLDEVEEARRMRTNELVRSANLSVEEQQRFNKSQAVPEPLTHSSNVLKRTRIKIAASSPDHIGEMPTWLNESITALLIERYGFDSGGGSRGKLSRASMTMLLNDPAALADEMDRYGERLAERVADSDAKAILARVHAMTEPVRLAVGIETPKPTGTVR